MGWLAALWAKSSGAIVKWIGIALAVLAMYASIRKSGRDAERVDSLKSQAKNVEVAHEVENKNLSLGDGASADRLRSKWSRD